MWIITRKESQERKIRIFCGFIASPFSMVLSPSEYLAGNQATYFFLEHYKTRYDILNIQIVKTYLKD